MIIGCLRSINLVLKSPFMGKLKRIINLVLAKLLYIGTDVVRSFISCQIDYSKDKLFVLFYLV